MKEPYVFAQSVPPPYPAFRKKPYFCAAIENKRNNRYGKEKNHSHRRPPHRTPAHRPLRGLAAPPRRTAECRRLRQDVHLHCRRAGIDRQHGHPRKGAPKRDRGGPRLPGLRTRPGEEHPVHTVADTRIVRTDLLLHGPGDREPPATQPHREDRDTDAKLRGKHPRRLLHLPHQPSSGHHRLQGHHRARGRRPGAHAGAGTRDCAPLQQHLRGDAG